MNDCKLLLPLHTTPITPNDIRKELLHLDPQGTPVTPSKSKLHMLSRVKMSTFHNIFHPMDITDLLTHTSL
jgi:hypothetical protein